MNKWIYRKWRVWQLLKWVPIIGFRNATRGGKFFLHDVPYTILRMISMGLRNQTTDDDIVSLRAKIQLELHIRRRKFHV